MLIKLTVESFFNLCMSSHYFVHLNLIQCCMSIIPQKETKTNKPTARNKSDSVSHFVSFFNSSKTFKSYPEALT